MSDEECQKISAEETNSSSDDNLLSHCKVERFLVNKQKKRAGRKKTRNDTLTIDLVDVILENDKLKTKLLLTNAKTVKHRQYYQTVIEERDPVFPFDVAQTRGRFKRCVSQCKHAFFVNAEN